MSDTLLSRLRDDESLFHLLVDSVQDYAIFALDADGHIATWNRGAQQIKGYTRREVLDRHFSLFFTSEDREDGRPARLLAAAAEHGRVEDEAWRVRKDGSRFWASVVITPLRKEDGSVFGFAKVTRDLTARRVADQELRMRERQLRDTQALAGLGSWEWDVAGDRVTWTDELYHIYGLDRQTFAATFAGYLERVHPDDRDRVRTLIEEAYRTGSPFEFEERIVRPSGEIRVLRSQGQALRNETGGTAQLLGACLDITDLKKAETQAIELAREQTEREAAESAAAGLRFLLEASEVLSSSLDYEATLRNVADLAVPRVADWCAVDLVGDDGSIQRVAVAHLDPERVEIARRLLRDPEGLGLSDRVRKVIEAGIPEFHPEIADEEAHRSVDPHGEDSAAGFRRLGLRSVVTVPLTGRVRTVGALTLGQAESDRRLSDYDVSLAQDLARHAAIAIENARLHAELALQNRRLAEQANQLEKQAEDLRQSASDAEEANRAKSDFLATMSHELRTPLNAIFGYADLIQLGVHGPVNQEQQDALERIKRNQRALLVLINDVLNFAKVEAGRLEITIADVPVREVISDLEKIVGPQLAAKELRYTCHPCEPAVHARGDRERIEQILLNLLTNAIKFTEPGGGIALTASATDAAVHIAVRDTGRGIPAERIGSIFDPFVQIDRDPQDSRDKGVGLGLAISRNLAEAMGGTLTVESAPGVGSTFTLRLPAGSGGEVVGSGAE